MNWHTNEFAVFLSLGLLFVGLSFVLIKVYGQLMSPRDLYLSKWWCGDGCECESEESSTSERKSSFSLQRAALFCFVEERNAMGESKSMKGVMSCQQGKLKGNWSTSRYP